jgi:thymidylate synthase ThyX
LYLLKLRSSILDFPSAKIVAHSQAPSGEELITFELELHRFILSQLNTHRGLSKNVQSSRAIPISKMIEQVSNDPAMPIHWGKNQRGMVAEIECNNPVYIHSIGGQYEGEYTREGAWKVAALLMAQVASSFEYNGYSKEVVNRLLEPWMKTKAVVTGTRKAFDAFFKLRCHPDAQAEIRVLAERMREALLQSTPNKLKYGEYHLPYVNHSDFPPSEFGLKRDLIAAKVKVSCSCAAQVSYRRLDDSLEKALKVYDMLNLPINGAYPDDPPHYSPTEHVAKIENVDKELSGNFHSDVFFQYRKALEYGIEYTFLENTK